MITILVPTINRSDFIERLLHYYQSVAFEGTIHILDSSDGDHARRIEKSIQDHKGLKTNYSHSPATMPVGGIIGLAVNQAQTPYIVFQGDDDFFAVESLRKAKIFLDTHADYHAATGNSVLFSMATPHGEPKEFGAYRQFSLEQTTARERLEAYLSKYFVPLFAVHRTVSFQRMYSHSSEFSLKPFADEYLPGSLSAVLGKIKKLDQLYMVRQVHPRRFRHDNYFDFITHSEFASNYERYQNILTNVLSKQDNISTTIAKGVVKQSFGRLLHVNLASLESRRGLTQRIKMKLESHPQMLALAKKVRSWQWERTHPFSLHALLKSNSSMRSDFLPIYQSIRADSSSVLSST